MIEVTTNLDGQPIRRVDSTGTFTISGECNQCGKCCEFYMNHGLKCDNYDYKTKKCLIQDKKPDYCQRYPASEDFGQIPKECSYKFIKKGETEPVVFTKEI